jgi:hypothetical protein
MPASDPPATPPSASHTKALGPRHPPTPGHTARTEAGVAEASGAAGSGVGVTAAGGASASDHGVTPAPGSAVPTPAAAPAPASSPRAGAGVGGGGAADLTGTGRAAPRAARLRSIRAAEIRFAREAKLGEGSFGSVLRGEWRGTDVAIKANSVDCVDTESIARESDMYVFRGSCVVLRVLCGLRTWLPCP